MCDSDFDAQSNFPLTSLWVPHLNRMADHSVPVYADINVCVCVSTGSLEVRSGQLQQELPLLPASFVSAVLPAAFSVTTSTQV